MIHRRGFLSGLFSAFAAPAIVRAASIMPVKEIADFEYSGFYSAFPWRGPLYEELAAVTQRAFVPRLFVQLYLESPPLKYLLDSQP